MDIARLAVLIWLFIPIPVYWMVRRWYIAQIRKYPSTTSGKIVDILGYWSTVGEVEQAGTTVTYTYTVLGTEHKGQASVGGIIREPGREIQIRYNPKRPEESRLDDLRDKVGGTAFLGIIWVLADLGYLFFIISAGLVCLFAAINAAGHRVPQFAQWTPFRTTLVSFLLALMGLPFVAIGVYGLIVDGFLAQNLLWMLWNHQTIAWTPW